MHRSTLAIVLLALLGANPGHALVLDFTDPTPAGPDAGTAGETLETGAPFTVGPLTITATPMGDSLAGDGLLANNDSFGIDSNSNSSIGFTDVADDIQFDGGEKLTLNFDLAIRILSIDLQGLVGSEAARITAGAFSIDLFTGVSGFNGTTDVYTPATPIFVDANTPIVFEGTDAGAAFGLQGMEIDVILPPVIPEPATAALGVLALAGLAARRRPNA